MPLLGPSLLAPADLTDLLAPAVSEKPDEIALASATSAWTWRELAESIDVLSTRLVSMGLCPGDRVASLMPNRIELLLHYLACLKAGLVVTPLNYRYTSSEIDYALSASGASILLAHAERADDIGASKLVDRLPLGLLSFDGTQPRAMSFEKLLSPSQQKAHRTEVDITTPAFLLFTSGSTGKPKGVTHSFSSFGSLVASFAKAMELTKQDVVLAGASLSHVGALSAALAGLSVGATVAVPRSFEGNEILPLLRDLRPSVLVMLPSALIHLQRDGNATRDDFGSLRLCVTGGDKFPESLKQEFYEFTGRSVTEAYGLTEAARCLLAPTSGIGKAGAVGMVCPGYVASIRDAKGEEVPANVDGTLWLKGAPVMEGYWNDPAATESAIVDGWFDTGDIMRVDSEGYFWFCGRKKQIIVRDGSNITPQEVETAVIAHPGVDLAAVVGVPDEVHGENVWAYVTLKDGSNGPRSEEILRFARERVGSKAPQVIVVLDKMPVTAAGKVDRLILKTWAEHAANTELASQLEALEP